MKRIKPTYVFAVFIVISQAVSRAGAEKQMAAHWDFLILGKIDQCVRTVESRFDSTLTYKATVIFEFRDSIAPRTHVTIVGQRMMERSAIVVTPQWPVGTYFLMQVSKLGAQGVYAYITPTGTNDWLPIGTPAPVSIREDQVTDLRAALIDYGKAYMHGGLVGESAESVRRLSDHNYFLWAWAVTSLAEHAQTQQDTWFLLRQIGVPVSAIGDGVDRPVATQPTAAETRVSVTKSLWIIHCLTDVVPENIRPSHDTIQAAISESLQRSLDAHQ